MAERDHKDVIVMVGLPARGKSYIAKSIKRYLHWTGVRAAVFNVGDYRRRSQSSTSDHDCDVIESSADFFRSDNIEAVKFRQECALGALNDIRHWLTGGGQVAILDATNSNKARRRLILNELATIENFNIRTLFIESICDDRTIIEANIKKVKVCGPDYISVSPEKAIADFKRRIENYERQYETIDEDEGNVLSYLKIYNKGERFTLNNMQEIVSQTQTEVIEFLMNLRPSPKSIFLDIFPYSEDQRKQMIVRPNEQTNDRGLNVISLISIPRDETNLRSNDDLVQRLRPVVMEIERGSHAEHLILCHPEVARCLIAYFLELNADDMPHLNLPTDDRIKVSSTIYGFKMEHRPTCLMEKHVCGEIQESRQCQQLNIYGRH